jgi:hypothetical protein
LLFMIYAIEMGCPRAGVMVSKHRFLKDSFSCYNLHVSVIEEYLVFWQDIFNIAYLFINHIYHDVAYHFLTLTFFIFMFF